MGGVLRFNLESDSISLHSRAHQGNTATLGGGGGGLPYIKGGDACREISNEPLKGTNLGVA